MNKADYEKIGSMSFIHLAELRHKGAFTTVSQTFTACCQRCGQSKDPSISSLPEAWYQVSVLIFQVNTADISVGSKRIDICIGLKAYPPFCWPARVGYRNSYFSAGGTIIPPHRQRSARDLKLA